MMSRVSSIIKLGFAAVALFFVAVGANAAPYLVTNAADNASGPAPWIANSLGTTAGGETGGAFALNASGDSLISPLLTRPGNLRFSYRRSSNTAAWSMVTEQATSTAGSWTTVDTLSTAASTWGLRTVDLSSYTNVYIRMRDTRASGTVERYWDNIWVETKEPSAHASGLSFSGVSQTQMTLTWTGGDGMGRLVVARSGSSPSAGPTDETSYSASTNFGAGASLGSGFVVYTGSLNSITVTNLSAGTTYYFAIYEMNFGTNLNNGFSINYYTGGTPLSGNQATLSAASPEIAVLGTNGALIAAGDNVPSYVDGTDFGVTSTTIDRTLYITNSGVGSLAISGVTTSGANASDFVVISWPGVVSPGARSNLVLRFDPTAGGVRTAAVVIANSDSDEGTYDFAVRGTGQVPPTVTTTIASATNQSTATAGGNVTDDGGATVTNRGVVWGASAGPTVPGAQTTNGTGTGSFSSTLTNLVPGETYYYRAFAQNVIGTSYGSEYSLTTPCFSGVVTGLITTVTNDTSFTAAWSNLVGATGYAIDVATNGAFSEGGSYATELIISEYGEGSSNNKWVEIYNGTGASVDLSDYEIWLISNGGSWPETTIPLSGTLAHGEAFLVVNSSASATFTSVADLTTGSLTPNGDDAVGLAKSSVLIDAVGEDGADPGTGWAVAGTANATVDHTLIRKSTVLSPNTGWDSSRGTSTSDSEWIVESQDYSSDLATHTMDTGSGGGDFVDGYQDRSIGNVTSYSVTGLSVGVTYYYRVRGTNANCITENSATVSVATVASIPEIAVSGNGVNIADGATTPTLTDHTDFGALSVAGGTLSRTYTITNTGTANLTLGNVTTTGTAAVDFIVTSQPSSPVAPNGSTTFTVQFDPSAAGVRTAQVSFVTNDGDENPFNFTVQGTGTAPEIAVSGNGVNIANDDTTPTVTDYTDFGAVLVAGGTLSRTYTITNSGNENLTVGNVTTSGTAAADFIVTSQPSSPVAPNSSTTFTVQFDPLVTGLRTAQVSFVTNDGDENPFHFTIQGTGAAPEIAVSGNGTDITNGDMTPSTTDGTDFGNVLIGNYVDQVFVITNIGNAQLTVNNVTTSGAHAAEFVITAQPSSPLNPDAATGFTVRFTPAGSGVRTAEVSFVNGDADESPFTFRIVGSGVASAPNIILLGTNLAAVVNGDTSPAVSDGTDFGAANANGGTVAHTFTITNSGTASLTISGITTSGTHAADFQITTAPGGSVAAGAATTFIVTFDPSSYGVRQATFSVANNDGPNNPYTFDVQGTGVAPEIAVSGNGVDIANGAATPSLADHTDFGSADIAGGTVTRTFTVTNTGNASLTLGTVTTSGTHAADFIVVAQPSSPVAVGNSATFQVQFDPSATGTRSAAISFSTDDPDENPFSFSIQGAGVVNPEIAVLGTNGALIAGGDNVPAYGDGSDFGGTAVTGGTVDRTLFVTNSGSGALTITGVTTTGTHAADFIVISWPGIVSAGARSNLVLRFDPSSSGARTAAVVVASDDADEAVYDFAVSGTGQVPPTVTTTVAGATNQTTAAAGGNVTADGFATVTNRGVVWAATSSPTVPGAQTTNGTGTGSFSSTLTNLTPGATYYYRAFAQNSAGTGYGTEYTLTTPCFSSAVTGLYASATNQTDFTAAWSAFAAATGYSIDVSTNTSFAAAGGAGIYTNDVEGVSKGSYASNTVTIGGVVWWMDDALIGSTASDRKNGAQSARIRDLGSIGMQSSTNMGLSSITLLYAVYGSDASSDARVEYTADGWTSWSTAGTFTATSTSLTQFEATNLNVNGDVAIRIVKTSGAGERINIDDIRLYSYGSAPSYIAGYSNRPVTATSVSVTGLAEGVTYYFRVRATNAFCVTADSATGSVTTLVGADVTPPGLVNFNANGGVFSDYQVRNGFSITGQVVDAGGISNSAATPYLFIKNNSNAVSLASNKFDTAPANGVTVLSALSESVAGAAYTNVTLGSYTSTVGAVDLAGNAAVSNFVFTVNDDDLDAPTISSADIAYGGVGSRYFTITTNSTPATITNRAGSFANVRYTLTDEELNQANARDLRFAFGARDATSGISRGTSGTTNTVMSFSLDAVIGGNFTNYNAALSSGNYTNNRTTNVWSFPAGFFTESMINTLMASSSNRVSITVPDDDNDRTNDQSVLYSEVVGWVSVVDDDAAPPEISGITVNGTSGSGGLLISQYYEGTSNNKWIELYNAGGVSIDLAAVGYRLGFWNNTDRETWKTGSAPTANLSLTGVVAAGGTYLISDASATTPSYTTANQTFVGGFNGDDSVVLYIGSTYSFSNVVDAFGVTGNTAVDTGYVRIASVAVGTNEDYNASFWTGYTLAAVDGAAVATVERLGYHVADSTALTLTDGALASGGYVITGLVHDVGSGIAVSNALAPYYIILNTNNAAVISNAFVTAFTNGSTAQQALSVAAPAAISTNRVTLGTNTLYLFASDTDNDRSNDYLSKTSSALHIYVVDDDTNAPALSGFYLLGGTTNFDLGYSSIAFTGLLSDVSGGLFGGNTYFQLLDGSGAVVQSNALFAGGGSAVTGVVDAASLQCGQDYTIRVFAADADLDRPGDQLSVTQSVVVVHTIGVGGVADYPIASNLLVNGSAASPSVTIPDSTMATGGWSLAFSLSHSVGVFTNATSPYFRVTNSVGQVLGSIPWSNGVLSGQTYFFTNSGLPAVSYAAVQTGLHYVVWSASNQGSCVAQVIDRGVITGGTNVFTVVDDDAVAPVANAFAVAGGTTTIDVNTALSGFAVTGLVQDVGSGIGFTNRPPYFLFLDTFGSVLASNDVVGGGEGGGLSGAVALSNFFSGLTLSCGESYTVRVVVADADNDRVNDVAITTNESLVIVTSGSNGDAPTAENLLLNNIPASSVTLTDQSIATGGWQVALSFTHSSADIVTNGADAPSFFIRNSGGTSLFGATPIAWSNLVKSGSTYYATNYPMSAAATNLITTGRYSVVWSARSEGLCFGATNQSAFINPGTNTFLVIDDDTQAPELYGVNVGGGSGTGCGGGGGCSDPTRTNLVAGDIAIFALNTKTVGSGSHVTNYDSFAFVALVDIPSGTEVKFTDNGWSSSTASFRSNEGAIRWRATNCVSAGTVVQWISSNAPQFSVGTLVSTNGSFAPNIEGEQLLAYQGSESSPNFIYAVNDRLSGIWDVDAVDSHSSALPPGLADGYTAVAVGEYDNVIINTNNLIISGNRELILYYIGDQESWIGSDPSPFNLAAYTFVFPDICASGGIITDHDMSAGGWSITGLVQDVGSGLLVSNAAGVRYMVINTNAGVVVSNAFITSFASGSQLLQGLSNAIPGGDYYTIQLGLNTARLFAADADADRSFDSSERMTNVAFTVIDDDYDIPQIGYFYMNGQTTITNAADLLSVVISGQVRDVTSGVGFTSAPPTYVVLDSIGNTVAAGGFVFGPTNEGLGLNWTSIWTAPINLGGIADCGVYTVRVTVADADNDRVFDRMQTNLNFVISVATGSGEIPVASNLLVNSSPAVIATLTDAEVGAGGWSLAMSMHHPIGLRIDSPYTPGFVVYDTAANAVIAQTWTNISTAGGSIYVTNDDLPGVVYANVDTGYFSVVWSARSQGACYGEILDSPLFGDGTNLIHVADDDAAGPTAASNLINTASYWTNNPVVTYAWDTGSVYDASGVAGFRLVTNSLAPTSMTDGISVGITNAVTLTNYTEGIVTNWLFAIDADNDRVNDGAMGAATSTVLYLDFTAPSQVADFAASPGAVDDTSEIDLSWAPLADAGNAALSPWDTYRIYYTQDGADPSTNDTYFDASLYTDLGTNVTGAITLQGLSMGSEYRLIMAGLDRAGNLGPVSGVQTVNLGQIIITQAVANAQSNPQLYWFGNPATFYDVIYADSTGYTATIDTKWKLAKTVLGTTFTDEGGFDEGSTNVRLAPIELPNKWMRFYRIAVANAWIPTAVRQGGATTQIVVALKTVLSNGYNFVGMGMTPFDNTLADFFGTNRLPASNSLESSTSISIYEPTATGDAETNAWWLSATEGWRYEVGAETANTQALPYPYTGFNILIPTNAPSATNLLLVGRVPWTNPPTYHIETSKYHVVSLNLPRPTRMSETGLKNYLTRGSSIFVADEIRVLQRGLGPFGAPKARIYVYTNNTYRYHTGGSGSADNFVIEADDSIILYTPKLTNAVTWSMPLPYQSPTLHITNNLSAAPIVLAQAPLSVTETSATLRGYVTPNGLASVAHIKYGATTNYGNVIAITNLPATNIAYQLSAHVGGLSTGTVYYFRVWASNSAGISRFGTGSFSTLGSCTNGAPSTAAATASDGTSTNYVSVSWNDVSSEDGYEIWRNTINNSGTASALATAAVNATNYNDTSATPGQQYYYWIKAYNCAGDAGFGTGNGGYRKLATVSGLSASYATYTNRVEVQWSDITGETGYAIYRHTADVSGSATLIGTVFAGAVAYTDATAVADTDYYYWVRATNNTSGNLSAFQSNGALGRRNSIGVPVLSSPTVSNILTTASVTGATMGATIDDDGGAAVTSRGTVWDTSAMPVGNNLAEGGSGVGTFSHARSNMPAGTLIYYRGWASNSVGKGYSSDGSFWTAPDRPVLQAATMQTPNSFQANWGSAAGATNYLLDVSTQSSFATYWPGYSNRLVGNATYFAVTNLTANQTNYWRVRAQNSGGFGQYSATNVGYTLAPEPANQARGLYFSSVGATDFTVNWTNGSGVGRLVLARQNGAPTALPVDGINYNADAEFGDGDQIGSGNFVVGNGAISNVTVTGLSTNTAYFFRVFEYNGGAGAVNYLTNSAALNPNGQSTL